MRETETRSPLARRSFLSRLGMATTAFGAAFAAGTSSAAAQGPRGGEAWSPTRHAQDDWMDELPGVHRFLFDNVSPSGFEDAMLYAGNFITVNGSDYDVAPQDLAVIIVARHNSTPFSFNDAMWEKYGTAFSERMGFLDPQTGAAPERNVFGPRLEGLFSRNLQLAVCAVATRGFAGAAARAAGAGTDAVFEEISRNLLPNSHLTPAGIVAVDRAQERGYSFSFVA
jgi:hypothetical protein